MPLDSARAARTMRRVLISTNGLEIAVCMRVGRNDGTAVWLDLGIETSTFAGAAATEEVSQGYQSLGSEAFAFCSLSTSFFDVY
jgi:hypothetical protein